jgi:glycogen phosphorylase
MAAAGRARCVTGRSACATWDRVRISRVEIDLSEEPLIGKTLGLSAWVRPAGLATGELSVQVCLGRLRENRDIVDPEIIPMTHEGPAQGDELLYEARIPCTTSGTHGVTVRALPHHPDLGHVHETGLISWAS